MTLIGPSDVGVASVSAAVTLAAIKTIDYLVRHRNGKDPRPLEVCRAQCDADEVTERLREYHEENRDILRDIRDGIKLLAALYRERTERRKEPRGD